MRSHIRGITLVAGTAALLSLTACGMGVEAQSDQQAVNAINPAADAQAQSNLQTAIVAAQTAASSSGSFAGVSVAVMQQNEPSLNYVTGPSMGPNTVSVLPGGQTWSAAVRSTSGTCFYAVVSISGTATGSAKAPCEAANAAAHAAETG